MENSTTVYVKTDTGQQVRVQMTHMDEAFPTPLEKPRERELISDEIRHVIKRLNQGDFQTDTYFPID